MADDIKIGLDGAPLENAAKPALDLLRQLQKAVADLDQANLKRLNKEVGGLVSNVKTLAATVATDMEKFVTGVTSAVDRAGKQAKPAAKAAGKKIGKDFVDAMEEEVSRAKVKVSAPRMVLPSGLNASVGGNGIDSASAVLAEARKLMAESGARTTQQIAAEAKSRADMLKMEADSSRLTYAARNNYIKAEVAERTRAAKQEESDAARTFAFRSNFYKANQLEQRKTSAQELADAQRTFAFRNNFYKSEQAELRRAAAAEAADATRTFQFRNSFYKAEQTELRKADAQEQTDAARTFRMRLNYLKAEQTEAQKAAAGRLSSIDRNASFAAASPSGQLSRASRVASAIGMGMSEADATAKYGAAAVAASRDLDRLRGSAASLQGGSKALAESQREVHSAFRGVAGAAGALFLTYGSLIPLTAAFFATTQIRDAIKAYKDLEYQIKFVQALEEGGMGMSERSVRSQLGATASDAGYDPVEAAKGMRLLAQSGLSAKESLQALPAVLKTATVGELSVAQATETLTGSVHAFGLELSQMGYVGDVLAKAGAISNTSVERMSESMKQASTVAQQYHMSIEDVSTAMVVLAKRNITGSAAGTSLTNMMRDLSNPHGRAKKAADELGFTAFDKNTGATKNLYDQILPELRSKLSKYTLEAQQKLIADLTNNRGEKLLSALLGTTDSELAEQRTKIAGAAGFVAKANDELMDSVEGDLKRLRAAYTTSLAGAGDAGSSGLRSALQSLRDVVSSPEFQQALSNLLILAGGLAKGFAFLANAMMNPVVQFGTVAAAAVTLSGAFAPLRAMLAGAVGTFTGAGAAATALGGGATAAAAGFGLLGTAAMTMLRVLAGFSVITAVIGLLALLYTKLSERNGTDMAIKASQDYASSLKRTNDQLAEQIRLKNELEGKGSTKGMDTARSAVAQARADLEAAQRAYAGGGGAVTTEGGAAMAYRTPETILAASRKRAEENLKRAQAAMGAALVEEGRNRALNNPNQGRGTTAERYDTGPRRILGNPGSIEEQINGLRAAGKKEFNPSEDRGGARREAQADYRNKLREIDNQIAANKLLAESADEAARMQADVLKTSYGRGVLSFDDYQMKLTAIQDAQTKQRIALSEADQGAVATGLADLKARAAIFQAKGGPGVPEQLANDIQAKQTQLDQISQAITKTQNDQAMRQADVLTAALKPASDILKSAEKEGALEDERMRQEIQKLQLKGSGLELSERDMFIQSEVLRILGEQEKKLIDAQRVMRELTDKGAFNDLTDPDTRSVYDKLQGNIDGKSAMLDGSRSAVVSAAGAAYDGKEWDGISKRLSGSVEGSIKEGLVAGLQGDFAAFTTLGTTLQNTVATALVDAFYSAFVKKSIDDLASTLVNTIKSAATGTGKSSSGGSIISGVLGLAGMFTGTSGITSSAGAVGTGAAAASAASAYGTNMTLGNYLKFDGGGYTGPGGRLEAAGIVHKGEFVVNAENTKRLGLGFLSSLNKNGYSDGGLVGATNGPNLSTNPAGRVSSGGGEQIVYAPQITTHVDSRSDRASVIADVQKVVTANQRNFVEQLKRVKALPA